MEYAAPTTVDEACTLLADNPGSRVFAGATDVVPQMRSGRPEPSVLIDLKRIDRLMSVAHDNGHWTIGAAMPTSELTSNCEFSSVFPAISEGAGWIGSDQIQNRSSLGGNLCNGSPAADSVPSMIASEARAVIAGADGSSVSTVTDVADEFGLALPATSVSFAVTLNVPSPCVAIVPDGTVTVALSPVMSPANSV